MVQHYNEAARSSGLTPEQAHAVVGDLIGSEDPATELSGPEFYNFDVAAIGLGFHHFEDPPLAVKRLGERLKAETGVLRPLTTTTTAATPTQANNKSAAPSTQSNTTASPPPESNTSSPPPA
jgi:hypothetical protein